MSGWRSSSASPSCAPQACSTTTSCAPRRRASCAIPATTAQTQTTSRTPDRLFTSIRGDSMAASSAPTPQQPRTRSGIVTFAGVMFLVVGAFNLLDGIVALVNDDYFVADKLLFGDLTAWGIWFLLVGAVQAVTGVLLLRRNLL